MIASSRQRFVPWEKSGCCCPENPTTWCCLASPLPEVRPSILGYSVVRHTFSAGRSRTRCCRSRSGKYSKTHQPGELTRAQVWFHADHHHHQLRTRATDKRTSRPPPGFTRRRCWDRLHRRQIDPFRKRSGDSRRLTWRRFPPVRFSASALPARSAGLPHRYRAAR